MTPTIAPIAVSLIAAGLCVAVGIMQWRISALKADATYERYKAEQEMERAEELLTEAKAEADNEYQLRRQAEWNLAEANKLANYWAADSAIAWHKLKNYSRPRDPKTGRFVKPDWVSDESREAASKALEKSMMAKPNSPTLIETDGLTARIVPKPHTLRHGMTVKDPTPEQAREIFEEAKRLGIEIHLEPLSIDFPWMLCAGHGDDLTIGACADRELEDDIYLTPSQFLAHMRGEDVETLCEEVKENASAGI